VAFPFAATGLETETLQNVFRLALPEAVLLAFACAIYLGGTFRSGRQLWASASLVGFVVAGLLFWNLELPADVAPTVSPLLPDSFAMMVKLMACVSGAALVLLSWDEVPDERAADFFASLLILVAGVSLVGGANDMMALFLSLELISIPTYVLLFLPRKGAVAQEAAVKYFMLSVFSSALLLFGLSYLYGIAGTTNLTALLQLLADSKPGTVPVLYLIAFVMIVAGLGFRITAVPFHFYAPDVFQGAPTSVAALLAFLPKIAGFAALLRVLGFLQTQTTGILGDSQVPLLLWLLAVITMTAGNVLALLQDNLKRILAYSSVAHAGYMLIGLAITPYLRTEPTHGTQGLHGAETVFFYLIAYGAMTLGAFGVLIYLQSSPRPVESVDDVAGLGRSNPLLALAFTLFLFSLIGLPLTAGFAGKFLLFVGALTAESRLHTNQGLLVALAVVGAVNAAIGAYYYLRIVAVMYLRESVKPLSPSFRGAPAVAVAACTILTVVMGIYPTPVIRFVRNAVVPIAAATASSRTTAQR
jgi:NADH-quinone oxidoreductase subunit N